MPAKHEGHAVGAIKLELEEAEAGNELAVADAIALALLAETLEATEATLETASEIAAEAEAIIELTEVGLIVILALAKALEMAEVGTALGIKAAASITKEVPFMTAKGAGIAVIPANAKALCKEAVGVISAAADNELCKAEMDEGNAVMFDEAKALGKTDCRAMAIALGRLMNISAKFV